MDCLNVIEHFLRIFLMTVMLNTGFTVNTFLTVVDSWRIYGHCFSDVISLIILDPNEKHFSECKTDQNEDMSPHSF